jgi:hypothetical protein
MFIIFGFQIRKSYHHPQLSKMIFARGALAGTDVDVSVQDEA